MTTEWTENISEAVLLEIFSERQALCSEVLLRTIHGVLAALSLELSFRVDFKSSHGFWEVNEPYSGLCDSDVVVFCFSLFSLSVYSLFTINSFFLPISFYFYTELLLHSFHGIIFNVNLPHYMFLLPDYTSFSYSNKWLFLDLFF